MAKKTCEYIEPRSGMRCHRPTKFGMRLQLHGESFFRWVLLCATCDKQQGRKTLTEKHGWLIADAIKWERDPGHNPTLWRAPFFSTKSTGNKAFAVGAQY